MMELPRETLLKLYYEMLRIRKVQLHIESLYHLDEMKTPIHLCIGQEAVAVGVCAHLVAKDYISSNHRGHGHYLAKSGDLRKLIAELHCRETGCSKGRGGSMHLVDTSVGHMGSSSIVGGGIPIAAGLALAARMQKQNRVSIVFFGDGAMDEGVLYETINFSILKNLPVVFVYENNGFSVCSRVKARQWGEVLYHRIPADHMMSVAVDGNNVIEVYEAAGEAVSRARAGGGPSLIECKTYRLRGHAGAGSDAHLGYRTQEEIAGWEARCPVTTFSKRLLTDGVVTNEEISAMEKRIDTEIQDAFQFARESSFPDSKDLLTHLYKEESVCLGPE